MSHATWRSLPLGLAALGLAQTVGPAHAAESPSLEKKNINMIIGYPAGGGVDATGRLIAAYLTKYLPGTPTILVRNMPGADGMVALNHFFRQVEPDGLTITTGSSVQLDPMAYRVPNAQYDPVNLNFIGGISRGGTFLLASKAGEKRLYDPKAEPVPMGAVDGTRSGEQIVFWGKEFLNWNAKWVVGYRGAADTTLALERGEVEMVSTSNAFLIKKMLDTGNFKLIAQSGTIVDGKLRRRSDFPDVPVFSEMIAGRIQDRVAREAFAYWEAICLMDPWVALPAETPAPLVAVYREAFGKVLADADFLEKGKKISEDLALMTHQDVATLVKKAATLSAESEAFLRSVQAKQGLRGKQ